MFEEIKRALRLSNSALDDEIRSNIDTALLELSRVGVNVNDLSNLSVGTNKLISKACELYCKWQFNFMGKGEQFQSNFEQLRDALSVTSQYTEAII